MNFVIPIYLKSLLKSTKNFEFASQFKQTTESATSANKMSSNSDKVILVQDNVTTDPTLSFPKKKLKILLMLIAAVIILLMYKAPNNFIIPDEDAVELQENLQAPTKTYNILFWSHFFGHHDWYAAPDGTVGVEVLKSVNCPVTNCFFTHNKTYVNTSDFDAIMIHGPDIQTVMPEPRKPNQLFIFMTLEAPTFIRDDLTKFKGYYNLTSSYRLDSDVQWDYGKVVDLQTKEPVAPAKNPNWKKPDENFFDESYFKIYQAKNRSIAWFVSNCNAFSKRQDLVKKMQQLIDVDIYGGCGALKCSGNECDRLLTNQYKFYLSFENSLCIDYVTEKLFRALNEFNIPIVYNRAKNMSLFAPPKSVINVNDYENVEELVKYLKYLMDNPREYIKYFWWKKHYKIQPHPVYPYTHCDLCKKLNDKDFMAQKHVYEDIHTWVRDNKCDQADHRIKF